MKKIACAGILVADIITEPVEKTPKRGTLENVNSITLHNGGNAMTTAINLKKLGCDSCIAGMVGDDMFGKFLKKRLTESGVDTRALKITSSAQTSASVLMIDKAGERTFFHCIGANGVFSVDDIDFQIIKEYDAVFLTGTFLMPSFDGKPTAHFLKKCHELGKKTFLDVQWDSSGKWSQTLDCAMPYIDVFMPSIDEAKMLAQKNDTEEIADVFINKGVGAVVIKMGGKGCFVKEKGKNSCILPAYKKINVIDTTGAGDSFCSGFLAAYARGEQFERCAQIANAVGAHCVTQKGATNGIKSYPEIIKFMDEYKEENK